MQNQIKKAIKLTYELFPSDPTPYRTWHYAYGFHRNKLLGIGQNNYIEQDGKAKKLAQRFKLQRVYNTRHAEMDLISRLWGKVHIDNRLIVVVIRVNRFGTLCESRPCRICMPILAALGITKIAWSMRDEGIHIR